jgi:hypothetical protein
MHTVKNRGKSFIVEHICSDYSEVLSSLTKKSQHMFTDNFFLVTKKYFLIGKIPHREWYNVLL